MLLALEDQVQLRFGAADWVDFYECEIDLANHEADAPLRFTVSSEDTAATFEVAFSENGVTYPQVDGPQVIVKYRGERTLSEEFADDPPQIYFADGDFLVFNELFKLPRDGERVLFDLTNIETRDWSDVDLTTESQGEERNPRSIQRKIIEELLAADDPYDVIFDDDGKGEIADIVAMRRKEGRLEVNLFHCKYAHGAAAGNRVADLYEVCGQAQKSIR